MFRESIDAGIVALIEDTGIGSCYLDHAPVGTSVPPYFTYNGNLGTNPVQKGDAQVTHYRRQFQVDLWSTSEGENVANVRVVREAINTGVFLLTGNHRVRTRFISVSRIAEPQGSNLTHYSFTGEVDHNAEAM